MEFYHLGNKIIAFTTDRNQGRDREKIYDELRHYAQTNDISLHLHPSQFMYPHQTHTDRIMRVTEEYFSSDESARREQREAIDAVISKCKGAVIGISTADCIPVVIYDSVHHAAAAVHAGWKGTVKRIVEKALSDMHTAYNTQPEDCTAFIGPGISQQSFEVGPEVVEVFTSAGFQMEQYTVDMPDMHGGKGQKPHIDLKEINRQQLVSQGVKPANIKVSDIDTYTDTRFYSARREQKPPKQDGTVEKCGRILSGFILL